MNGKTFLITGANGQLGQALRRQYLEAQTADIGELDITNRASVEGFDWSGVKVIINAGAYTNVDGAESVEGRVAAWSVNALAVVNLARVALNHDLTLVHVSTDYVFDGRREIHDEDEPPSPLSVYGASKAAGDMVAGLLPRHYLVRTSWVIGAGKNFVRTMLEAGRKGINPTVVADQIGRPTFTGELVRAIDHLLKTRPEPGTYNVSNAGESVSWAELTRVIFSDAGLNLKVTDTTTAEYFADKPGIALRPQQSTLNLSKLEATGFKPRDWREDLRQYIEEEIQA